LRSWREWCESLPPSIQEFIFNVEWPERITYKKLSAGPVEYVQYTRLYFFAGADAMFRASKHLDLSRYRATDARLGSSYILPIGRAVGFDDGIPYWLIMSIIAADDPTLILVKAEDVKPSTPESPFDSKITIQHHPF